MTVFEFQEKYPTREAKEEALKHMTDDEIDEIIASCTTTQGKIWYSQHKRRKKKAERKGSSPRSVISMYARSC